jgi:general L-amino acid transport system substrate-binding protein
VGTTVQYRSSLSSSFQTLGLQILCLLVLSGAYASEPTSRLSLIKERGHLICGTSQSETGFSAVTADGRWSGIYIDLCRALAGAVLGDTQAVKFRPLAGPARFKAVAGGEVDVLARGTAWTLSRDSESGVQFAAPFFYDGTAFMIQRSNRITSALELSGASICFVSGGLTEKNVSVFFDVRGMKFTAAATDTWSAAAATFDAGRCQVLAADRGRLAVERSRLSAPDNYVILPELASNDVFGPVVASNDPVWAKIVRWVVFGLIGAEDLGVDAGNVAGMPGADDPRVRQMAKAAQSGGRALGLADGGLVAVIQGVGNYGEIFERSLGSAAGIGLERGRNQPPGKGGMLFSPAFR